MTIPEFDLARLMKTIFKPRAGERAGVFIDLPQPGQIKSLDFLKGANSTTQKIAHAVFYQGLLQKKAELGLSSVDFFAYEPTGGSNLDLPEKVTALDGRELNLVQDVLAKLDIVLYLSTYSATAPLTALAKQMGFRGATMHGCNEIVLRSGLSKDYNDVSAKAERFRQALTRCDEVTIIFDTKGKRSELVLELGRQEAQKSHGLCHERGDIANLPAGEIYWVPSGARGEFPMRFKEDGTIGIMKVADGRITDASILQGNEKTLSHALETYRSDPATGALGELGLGTQVLPVAGVDIQDEKILGTVHVATGRDDHLGGDIGPEKFKFKKNATHEDVLFAPHKTPEIVLREVWMQKNGDRVLLIQDYQPTDFVRSVAL